MKSIKKQKVDLSSFSRKELEEMYLAAAAKSESQEIELQWLRESIASKQKKMFGKSSEKISSDQLSLFDEAELESTPIKIEPKLEEITYKRKKKGKHHKELDELETTKIIEYKLSEEERECPKCENTLHVMSKVVRKELIYIPMKIEVHEHVKYVYACRECEETQTEATIIDAVVPKPVIAGSLASSSLLAHVICEKYDRAIPLYRQEVTFTRLGVNLSRQTMSNWIMKLSDMYLSKVFKCMKEDLLKSSYLLADETTVNVLHEPGKESNSSKSYMWVYKSGRSEDKKITLFQYEPSRKAENAIMFLKGYSKSLQSDGYAAYNKIEDVEHYTCWAHARRYVKEAVDLIPKTTDKQKTISYSILLLINKLFKIERECC